MSKYKEITTQITDQDHIIRALDDMQVPYEVAQQRVADQPTQELRLDGYGRQVRTAAVAVRRDNTAPSFRANVVPAFGDFGWTLDTETGTYRLVIDDMDERKLHIADIVQGVAQRAALYQLEELAATNGFDLNIVDDSDLVRVRIGA